MLRRALPVLVLLLGACSDDSAAPVDAAPVDVEAPDALPACQPSAGAPIWLAEGQTVEADVACATGLPLPASAFTVEPLPAGALWDSSTAHITWTPTLAQAGVYQLSLHAAGHAEVGALKIGVADLFDADGNVLVDPATYTEEYGLPVFHAFPSAELTDVDYTPTTIIYRGHTYNARMKKRGAASIWYPKNSFAVKFDDADLFAEPAYAGGFVGKHRLSLTTTFDDNSYVRTRMAFEMWNRLSPDHLQVQSYSAVLFLDGEYFGLYQVTDKVAGPLMAAHGLNKDGNLYKAVSHDANFRLTNASGGAKATLHDGYTKEEGTADTWDDLDALVSFVATSSADDFRAGLAGRVSLDDFEDWYVFATLIQADDSYGKNAYLYHDPATAEPFRYVPWDFNHAFGQTWQTEREGPTEQPTDSLWTNEIWVRILDDATLAPGLAARYADALAGPYAADAVLALYDAMIVEVAECARRDERKWRDAYRSYDGWSWRSDWTTFDAEAAYVRDWIQTRWVFVDAIY
jgi:spore coat protein H